MFLVTFMWMLMEGVVLYVALVRVFIKHPKRYIMCFTLLSYGMLIILINLLVLTIIVFRYSWSIYVNYSTYWISYWY